MTLGDIAVEVSSMDGAALEELGGKERVPKNVKKYYYSKTFVP